MKSLYIFETTYLKPALCTEMSNVYAIFVSTHYHCFLSSSRAQFPNAIQIPSVTVLRMNIETEDRK